MKKMALIGVCVFAMAIIVAVFGFLSSGYKSTDLTFSPEAAPEVKIENAVTCDGWRLGVGSWGGDNFVATSYKSIGITYIVDHEVIEKYEKQGYKVEYGVILGVGTDKTTNTVYNTPSKLAVKEVDGRLISATEGATAYLAYSSDKEVEVDDIVQDVEGSPFLKLRVSEEFDGNISADGDASLDTKTYVSAAFVRLTDSNGKANTEYILAREVYSIVPFEFK